ncbi:MAG: beta-ketoacyl-[acyl-carrier-protein] synthase family protein [Micromonosporaceae bacterium]
MAKDQVRVVVTGIGATTPLGGDIASTWSAMLAGKSGVRRLTEDWADDLPVRIGAPAAVDPAGVLNRVKARRLDRYEQFALVAAQEAWQHAGSPEADPDRLGVSFSSGVGGMITTLTAYDLLKESGWQRVPTLTVPMLMPNGAAGWISLELGARAGAHAPASACSSGAEAIGYGIEMIRSGRADVVVAGGTEAPIHPLHIAAFAAMRALSTRNDEPERASRPFDKNRDGFVLGEGAAAIVLESAEHAARRGAAVLAVAVGVGYSADAHHIAQPDPRGAGAAAAMRRALADAGVAPEQVMHVNAHATSTLAGDPAEVLAIASALGDAADGTVVSATKSMTGHLIAGAGALESVAAICALRESVAPPTINLEDLDDDIAATGVGIATQAQPLKHSGPGPAAVMNNSFGFGGHNVALVFTAA